MQVYILTNSLKQGGAEKQSVLLAKALQGLYPTTLIVYYGNLLDERLLIIVKENNISTFYLTGSHISKVRKLFYLFRKNTNAIVFSYLATTNTINAIIGKIAGVKYRIGGIRAAKLVCWKMVLQRFLHNYLLTATVFNNNAGKERYIKKGYSSKKSFVINNSISIQGNCKVINKNKTNINILSVGRFVEPKDYYTALESFKLLLNEIHNLKFKVHYTIIGYGKLENDIRKWIEQFDLNNNVSLVINPPNLQDYYKKTDIYLSTSLFEGLSNSIMEAMEYSLPVVATNVGDNNCLVLNGETGYLTPVRDSQQIAENLNDLITNHEKRIEFGKRGYNHLVQNFSEKKFKENYLQLIEKITHA